MNQFINADISRRLFQSEHLYTKILQWGATITGFGDVRCGLASEFSHIPGAISIAIKHPMHHQSIVRKDGVTAYTNQFSEIDEHLEIIQKKIVTYLRTQGWRALAIPADSDQPDLRFVSKLFPLFQHKTAATCSGLGWIGKNGLLVHRQYGARLSWASVLTNAQLQFSNQPYREGQCGECNNCVAACPAEAISSEEWLRGESVSPKINVEACASQLGKNKKILGSNICGLCILACPHSYK